MRNIHTDMYDRKVNTRAEVLFLSVRLMNAYGHGPTSPLYKKFCGAYRAGNMRLLEAILEERMQAAVATCCSQEYVLASSLKALFSKNAAFSGPHCEESALATFWRAERECRRANRRLALHRVLYRCPSGELYGQKYRPYLDRARRIIQRILGDKPTMWDTLCRHGGGVAIGRHGTATSAPFKDAAVPYNVTLSAGVIFQRLVESSSVWAGFVSPKPQPKHPTYIQVVDDRNKLAFVPKNWKTHRSICVEPLGNLYIQQGLGREIALRLKRIGVNIFDDGQDRHRRLACEASKMLEVYGNGPVTLDLSMASDTLCTELVRTLLPEAWFNWLDSARCHATLLPDGSTVRTSKFSSMGNAATFPLETLIFYALAKSVQESTCHSGTVSAYGDDIIVPRGSALLLMEVLRFVGFTVNPEKSYVHGEFYESCGADYLRGVPVRPFYLKRDLRNVRDWNFLYNAIHDDRYGVSVLGFDDDVRHHLLRAIGRDLFYGPQRDHIRDGIPDGWIETDNRALWKERRYKGQNQFRSLCVRPVKRPLADEPALISTLRSGDLSRVPLKKGALLDTRSSVTQERWVFHDLYHGAQASWSNTARALH